MKKSTALLIVDVQNDFCSGGSLPVPAGDQIVPIINITDPIRLKSPSAHRKRQQISLLPDHTDQPAD